MRTREVAPISSMARCCAAVSGTAASENARSACPERPLRAGAPRARNLSIAQVRAETRTSRRMRARVRGVSSGLMRQIGVGGRPMENRSASPTASTPASARNAGGHRALDSPAQRRQRLRNQRR